MEKGSEDSDSDDLEIVSEAITNFGNCPTPEKIAPELREKVTLSQKKLSAIPGIIKASIKVYATNKNKNEKIKASFTSANGKLGQVTNRIVTNNHSRNKNKSFQSLVAIHSVTVKPCCVILSKARVNQYLTESRAEVWLHRHKADDTNDFQVINMTSKR